MNSATKNCVEDTAKLIPLAEYQRDLLKIAQALTEMEAMEEETDLLLDCQRRRMFF